MTGQQQRGGGRPSTFPGGGGSGGGGGRRGNYGGGSWNDRNRIVRENSIVVGGRWKFMEEYQLLAFTKLVSQVEAPKDMYVSSGVVSSGVVSSVVVRGGVILYSLSHTHSLSRACFYGTLFGRAASSQ